MRVVIAAEIFPPDIGGPATYSVQIANLLHDAGWDVQVICYSTSNERDTYPFRVARIARRGRTLARYLRYAIRLWKLAAKADLLYAQGPVSAGLPTLIVSWLRRKPYVVKVVGDYAWEQARNQRITQVSIDEFQRQVFSGKIGRLRAIQRQVCRHATCVITPSQYLRRLVTGWGVAAKSNAVIYNAFEGLPEPTAAPTIHGDVILSVGRLVPWKGFATLIRLLPDLLQQNPKFHLVILGSGPLRSALDAVIAELKLGANVTIIAADRQAVANYFSQAKLFVLNTGYEGLSHTILEAMAAGVPVITTNVCGNPEIITDGVNGTLVAYDDVPALRDAILALWRNSEHAAALSAEAKKSLERFRITKMQEQTIHILHSVCAS